MWTVISKTLKYEISNDDLEKRDTLSEKIHAYLKSRDYLRDYVSYPVSDIWTKPSNSVDVRVNIKPVIVEPDKFHDPDIYMVDIELMMITHKEIDTTNAREVLNAMNLYITAIETLNNICSDLSILQSD